MNPGKEKWGAEVEARLHVARRSLRDRKWTVGQRELAEALAFAERRDLPEMAATLTRIQGEIALHFQCRIPPEAKPKPIDASVIRSRQTLALKESTTRFPNAFFFFDTGGERWVGRKTISESWIDYTIPELHCSRLRAPMLLGIVATEEKTRELLSVSYYPLASGEKLSLFEKLAASDAEVRFPHPRLERGTPREWTAPESGWKFDPARAKALAVGEKHLREAAAFHLRTATMDGKTLYDPACSTGEFLSSLKAKFPKTRTVGQDLSSSMVEQAKKQLDSVYLGDAATSPVPNGSCDFIFVRFLNHEVVTSKRARELFPQIAKRLRAGGELIVFGHTPVHLDANFFSAQGLEVKQRLARTEDRTALFQWYAMGQKP